jgi:hypothetical protein
MCRRPSGVDGRLLTPPSECLGLGLGRVDSVGDRVGRGVMSAASGLLGLVWHRGQKG